MEITEGELVHNIKALSEKVNALRRQAIIIAIDDFGAGYAGLNMLADLQPDLIKLDMNLLRDIHRHGPRQSIVKAIYEVCMDLGIDILAEGVESPDEYHFLSRVGIELYQGYFFAKPGFECFPKPSFLPQG